MRKEKKDLNVISPEKVQISTLHILLTILRIWFKKARIIITGQLPADACSSGGKGREEIYLMDITCAESPMKELKGKELVLFMFGLFFHELFHLFYSDFTYPKQAIEAAKTMTAKYPKLSSFLNGGPANVRLTFRYINIIEDGHIERRGKKNYPLWRRAIDFMNKVYFRGLPAKLIDHDCNKEGFQPFQSYFVYALNVALTGRNYDLDGCGKTKKFENACRKSRVRILDAVYENDARKRIDKALAALDEVLSDLPKPTQQSIMDSEKEMAKHENARSAAQGYSNPSPTNSVNNQGLQKPPKPEEQKSESGTNSQKSKKSARKKGKKNANSENGTEKNKKPTNSQGEDENPEQTKQSESGSQEGEQQVQTAQSSEEQGTDENSSLGQETESSQSEDFGNAENEFSNESDDEEPYDFEEEPFDAGSDMENDDAESNNAGNPGGKQGGNGEGSDYNDALDDFEDSIYAQIERDLETEFAEFEENKALRDSVERTVAVSHGKNSRFVEAVSQVRSVRAVDAGKAEMSNETKKLLNKYIDQTVASVAEEVKTRTEDEVVSYQLNGIMNSELISNWAWMPGIDKYRIFDRVTEGEEGLDIVVELLIDESGSMSGKQNEVYAIAYILHGICGKLGIPIRVASYDGRDTHIFADFNSAQQQKTFERRILNYRPNGGTNEGSILRLFEKSFVERPEKCKYLFMITDGEPGGFITNGTLANELGVANSKQWLQKYQMFLKKAYGIQMIACCIGSDAPKVASIYTGAKIIFNDYKVLAKRLTEEFLRPLRT